MASAPHPKLNINNFPSVCKEEYYYNTYFKNGVKGRRQCSVGSEQESLADKCDHCNKPSYLTKYINTLIR
jgi:hypothetical protein